MLISRPFIDERILSAVKEEFLTSQEALSMSSEDRMIEIITIDNYLRLYFKLLLKDIIDEDTPRSIQ